MWKLVRLLYAVGASVGTTIMLVDRWRGASERSYWVILSPLTVPLLVLAVIFLVMGSRKHA